MSTQEKEYIGSFKSISTPMQVMRHDLYIDDAIMSGDSSVYNHYQIFNQSGEGDVIYLWVNSDGGSLDVANTYVQHIDRCAATVISVIGLNCASAASYIALSAQGYELSPLSTMLIHGFSYMSGGKAPDVHDSVMFNSKLNQKFLRETYTGLLTEEEFQDCFKGRDILLDSEELSKRLPSYLEYRELKRTVDNLELEVDSLQSEADELESSLEEKKPVKRTRRKSKE